MEEASQITRSLTGVVVVVDCEMDARCCGFITPTKRSLIRDTLADLLNEFGAVGAKERGKIGHYATLMYTPIKSAKRTWVHARL